MIPFRRSNAASHRLPPTSVKSLILRIALGKIPIAADHRITSASIVRCYPVCYPAPIPCSLLPRFGVIARAHMEPNNAVAQTDRENRRECQAADAWAHRILGCGAAGVWAARHRKGRQELDRALSRARPVAALDP